MDKDIDFALAILRNEYDVRRKYVVESNDAKQRDNVLCDLERIHASILKISYVFDSESESKEE